MSEDWSGMWTVTYPDGSEQTFNSEADARAAVKRDGRDKDVEVERHQRAADEGEEPSA